MGEHSDLCAEWQDWPAARQPGRAAVAGLLVIGTVLAVATVEPWLGVVGGALLLGAVGEVLLPARYRVDADGATVARALGRRTLPWARVARVLPHPDGLLLRARGARPWLARRHDLVLRAPPGQARALVATYGASATS